MTDPRPTPRLSLGARFWRLASTAESALGMLRAPGLVRRFARRNRSSTSPVTGTEPVVVSLTTYGARLAKVHLTIESIAAGQVRPRRLILWVDDESTATDPPEELRRLRDRGLEVRATRDLGPYKKFYPTLALREPGESLVTADDDVLYPDWWLKRLVAAHRTAPDAVHCYRAREFTFEGAAMTSYSTWPLCYSTRPGLHHFPTGVSGVLYPPHVLDALTAAGEAFLKTAPRSDDVWLHFTSVSSGASIHQLSRLPRHFPEIPGSQKVSLFATNLRQGGNDPQLQATYTPEVLELIRQSRSA